MPQTLLTPAANEIFVDATSGNAWTNRNLRQIIRTIVDVSIPISTPIHSGIRKYFTTASSDSSGIRITIVTSDTTTTPPCGLDTSPNIGNVQKSANPYLRDLEKLDTPIDENFTNNLVAPPIFTDAPSDKLSTSSSRDIYARVGMHLTTDTANYMIPQLVDLGFSTVDTLDKSAHL